MKTLARIGAILSFILFFLPAVMLFRLSNGEQAGTMALILGLCLLGVAVFLGTILWVVGERFGPKQENR